MQDSDLEGDVDLSGVRPERRETVRHRIAAVQEYDDLRYRRSEDMLRLSAQLGVSIPSFYRLWRSWRTHRDPAALQGPMGGRNRTSMKDEPYVRSVLESIPKERTIESQVIEIEMTAASEGAEVRSRSALRRLVRSIRSEAAPPLLRDCGIGTIAVDVLPIEIAVEAEGMEILPLTTAILHPETGTTASVMLSLGSASPQTVALGLARWMDELPEDTRGTRVTGMLMPFARGQEWDAMWSLLDVHGITRRERDDMGWTPGSVVRGCIGDRMLGFDLRPRMTNRPSKDRRPLVRSSKYNRGLTLEEAQTSVDERIRKNGPPALFVKGAASLASEIRAACAFW